MPDQRPIVCPDCGGPVRPDLERLCPRCGYPLMFLRTEPEPDVHVVARAPGEADDATTTFPSTPATPVRSVPAQRMPQPGEVLCVRCGQDNPLTRVRCQRCGHELRVVPLNAAPPPPLPPPPPPIRRPFPWLLIVAALLLVVLLALLVFLLLTRD